MDQHVECPHVLLIMQANPYRKVLEDDGKGRQLVETESLATWRFLMFKGACCRRNRNASIL